jgi:hypothetical protein
VARVDADVQRQATRLRAKLRGDARELVVHLERDEEGALRVVLVRNGSAEEGEQGVAGELLDVSLVASDNARESADHRVDDLQQLLRIETVGERREPRDIGEERRDKTAFLRELATRLD